MKDNYNKGFLTGVGVTLGIILAIIVVYFLFFNDFIKKMYPDQNNYSSENNPNNYTGEEKEKYDSFITKQNNIISIIQDKYYEQKDLDTLYWGACNGLVSVLEDPYSAYYTKEDYEALTQTTDGEYVGIGCYVAQQVDSDDFVVVSVIEGGPAEKAGMLPSDVIIKIDGTDVRGKDFNSALAMVRGRAGTKVVVTVKRGQDEIDLSMQREKVEQKTISYEMLEGNVGYIRVESFYKNTTQQFDAALKDLESKGMEKLIMDLRDNPGGLFDVVVDMLDIFLDKDLLVAYIDDKAGNQTKSFTSTEESFSKPMVILINGNSASGSELFTQTMKDYEKAVVMGTKSFGKGIYQDLYHVGSDGSAIKLTCGRYYSPKGVCIHGVGIEPDITLEYVAPENGVAYENKEDDNQIKAAMDYLMEH